MNVAVKVEAPEMVLMEKRDADELSWWRTMVASRIDAASWDLIGPIGRGHYGSRWKIVDVTFGGSGEQG